MINMQSALYREVKKPLFYAVAKSAAVTMQHSVARATSNFVGSATDALPRDISANINGLISEWKTWR